MAGVLIPRSMPQLSALPALASAEPSSYWLTRSLFLRCLGGVFSVAFSVALRQNPALIGDHGVTPAKDYLKRVLRNGFKGDLRAAAKRLPTLFWLLPPEAALDPWLKRTAVIGLSLSILVTLLGAANLPIILALWVLYHTLANVGQHWYGFGWENQLLETAFLTAFAVPLLSLQPFPATCPPPAVIPWLYKWLAFRIMFGAFERRAGLIKIRGDKVWKDLTAMDYHYETQPLPNPISYFLHQAPKKFHRFETAMNHIVELGASWLLLAPVRALSLLAGGIQTGFQLAIIISGNLSFLNYLTILPFIWCFDDRALAWLFPGAARSVAEAASVGVTPPIIRSFASWFLVGVVGCLSAPVVRNMASKKQSMNRAFEPLRIVNTYGAFGSISKARPEIIIKGALEYDGENTAWREYEFRSKPGPLSRSLPWVSPYHRRLDWCLWIAALGHRRFSAWFPRLLLKLVDNDREVSKLMKTNPFLGKEPPKYVKADMYRYRFTKFGSEESKRGQVWTREVIGSYWGMTSRDGLVEAIGRNS
ncbi:conserved unknown protein [Ectocarpus siliculosus]|uniref:Lipase maturation factor family protein n=1 Tax=Ectocarpus siliculosus TaxID=2880 RepID=D7FTX6_ECTSI|nr:conserved unknown protein [Ectocarpus siliculosus]|eukprot:CBJ31503.1 conserved unknown protein [Ectocarpus siliculosus]